MNEIKRKLKLICFFQAPWQLAFETELIKNKVFSVAPFVNVKTNFMRQRITCKYIDSPVIKAKVSTYDN